MTSIFYLFNHKDYANEQQLDVVDNITTTDNTKQFLKLINLLQNVDFTINFIASNSNGQSQISNSIVCSTNRYQIQYQILRVY